MKIQQLPNDIFENSAANLVLYDYHINKACVKNKIMLTKNVFSFLVEGSKELITHNHVATIKNDKFLLIKSGNCLMSENLSPSNNYRSILMFFSDENVIDFCEKYQIGITNNVNNNPYHICNYDGFITHFVQSLMQIKNYADNLQQQLLQPKFEEIMLYLVHKKGVEFIADLVENQNDYIRHFKEVIENNKLNHLSIQELAFLSNMSLSTFKRTFEKNYKTSPSKWFQDKRLAYAAFLLTNKKERPIDVYENIGYESLSSFTQAFKEKFGTTPKQFQLQN